ncbi:adenylosuccinate lyase family protein [uncultured Devosia sp.]|uniref:class-II fumarase/aspartase family protein n=1 Tax=uncultured Devosia sp. TaxID=211434 RepID=UPI00261AC0DD|nr:adenylosuccinate lyase family protein [uncultured Devosia sp.]
MAVGAFDSFITRSWFDSAALDIWSDTSTLQAWLDVEAGLAEAEAQLGLVPSECARAIKDNAKAELFDLACLDRDIRHAQHPFVPVLKQFEVLCGEPAAGFIHLGATTQNIFDTAVSLQMRRTHDLILDTLDKAIARLRALAGAHATTLQAGRTHGQHALPMTFGFKVAGWVDELERGRARLAERFDGSFVASLGGAIGTGAALDGMGRDVEARLAQVLGLKPAGLAIRSSYDRVADYVSSLGVLIGGLERVAQDIVFLQRTEIGEVREAFHHGKVGSSTMAQKRNPSTCLRIVSLCRLVRARMPLCLEGLVRMDEGDSSSTNVTDVTLPEIAILAASAVAGLAAVSDGLVVDGAAMERNLAITGGLINSEAIMMRLAPRIGRHAAHHLLYEAAQGALSEGRAFSMVLQERAGEIGITGDEMRQLMDPSGYVGDSVKIARRTANGDETSHVTNPNNDPP